MRGETDEPSAALDGKHSNLGIPPEGATPPASVADSEVILESVTAPDAFAVIFERHVVQIYAYVARRLDEETAEEVTSEVFAKAFEHRKRYLPDRQDALPWLYGIAAHEIQMEFRRRRGFGKVLNRLRAFRRESSPSPEEELSSVTLAPHLESSLKELGAGERQVLLLHVWNHLSYEEIAKELGIPIGTVRSRLSRARRKMQRSANGQELTGNWKGGE